MSSISMFFLDSLQFGLKYQVHQLILFLCLFSAYNYQSNNKYFDFLYLEKIIFTIYYIILIYGLLQLILFYIANTELTFGMDEYSWRNNVFSYRQDIINPNTGSFENAPWMRPSSFFGEPTFFGMFLLWLFVVLVVKYFNNENNKRTIILIIISIILLLFIASRAALFSILLTSLMFLILEKKYILKALIIVFTILFLVYVVEYFSDIKIIEGWTIARFDQNSIQNDPRMLLFGFQIEGFLDNPLIGNGRGSTVLLTERILPEMFAIEEGVSGWSFWLSLLYDSGLLGALSIVFFMIFLYSYLNKNVSETINKNSKAYYYGVISILFYGIFFGTTLNGTFWLGLSMIYLSTLNNKLHLAD